jgi:hypothetical protein
VEHELYTLPKHLISHYNNLQSTTHQISDRQYNNLQNTTHQISDRQYNNQKKYDVKTNNCSQNAPQETKDYAIQIIVLSV